MKRMVSNKNRVTRFRHVDFHEDAVKEFESCMTEGETKTDTLLKIVRSYKSKCLDHQGPGVIIAD